MKSCLSLIIWLMVACSGYFMVWFLFLPGFNLITYWERQRTGVLTSSSLMRSKCGRCTMWQLSQHCNAYFYVIYNHNTIAGWCGGYRYCPASCNAVRNLKYCLFQLPNTNNWVKLSTKVNDSINWLLILYLKIHFLLAFSVKPNNRKQNRKYLTN
jgi:hypothetical protein